jgi:hypothetical protein
VNPGEILLVGLALICSGWAVAAWRRGTRASREQRLREKRGAENAAREHQRAVTEVCAVCGEPIAHEIDLFDEKTRQWWHRRCWRDSMKAE